MAHHPFVWHRAMALFWNAQKSMNSRFSDEGKAKELCREYVGDL